MVSTPSVPITSLSAIGDAVVERARNSALASRCDRPRSSSRQLLASRAPSISASRSAAEELRRRETSGAAQRQDRVACSAVPRRSESIVIPEALRRSRPPGRARSPGRPRARGTAPARRRRALDEIERVRGRRHAGEIQLRYFPDRLQDRGQLLAKLLDLLVGQREPRELRDVQHLCSRNLHSHHPHKNKGPPFGGPGTGSERTL